MSIVDAKRERAGGAAPVAPRSTAPAPAPGVGAACAHCGLPVPSARRDPVAPAQFCCEGCRTVHEAIRACGLERFYALRAASGEAGAPARLARRRYEEFDDPAFARLYARPAGAGLEAVDLVLEGIHCAACVWLIERLPHILPGVAETRVDFGRRVVRVVRDPDAVPLSLVARRLESLGYAAHPLRGGGARRAREAEDRRMLVRIAVAGALAGNVMVIAFALYGGAFHGMEPQHLALFRWASLGLTTIAVVWPGRVFFRGAFGALRARTLHMDVPVALGVAAGWLSSAVATVRGTGAVYFDSVSVLIFLLLVGRWVQLRQQRRSGDALELLFSMTPGRARVLEDGEVREIPVEALVAGRIVEVRAGEPVPVDGTVVEGCSELNVSWVTGESAPVSAGPGDRVAAGTTNLASRLVVRVDATGEDTRIGRLMALVEEAARRRAPVVRLADRLAGLFVVVVVAAAVATALFWWIVDPPAALPNAIALLIVTCPCALGLATPLAIVAGIGRAARCGILIKGGEVVELLRGPGLILLDKTGTLTEGSVAVREWHGPDELRPVVAALERGSAHPVARALAALAEEGAALPEVRGAVETAGGGIEGFVGGRAVAIGGRPYLAGLGIDPPGWARDCESAMAARAVSPVFVAVDGEVAAVAGVGDPVRPEAGEAVAALRRLGWEVGVLSGDHPRVVEAVAAEVGIEPDRAHGGLAPEAKVRFVEAELEAGPVLMVGDGVNDAAALATATVGVAVHGGAEASLAAADVYLAEPGLGGLPALLRGARRTVGVIHRNLIVSLLYNVVGASLAMAGLIDPLLAAVLMPVSSLTVITLSYRSRTFEVEPCR